ncbi:MAG: MaoC family dehydratase [Acidobacteria bacterium]|nr:MaoC family dehydratase [Acidobacteriota bacterium]
MKTVRFDDIAALRAEVTEEFGPWGEPVEIKQTMINAFADLSGDHNWIHVDVERARRESPFGQPIAHGMLTLSLFANLPEGADFRVTGFGNSTNYGIDRIRFLAPVPAGAHLQASVRLADVQEKKYGTLLAREVKVRLAGEDRLVFVARPLVLFMPPNVGAIG